jgi:hypothetical protein
MATIAHSGQGFKKRYATFNLITYNTVTAPNIEVSFWQYLFINELQGL